EAATLSIETYVREDQIKLFGFPNNIDREWFRTLQTVQGVGAKVAMSVLSTLKASELASAVAMRDKATVARSPGVGQKVAERIVTELKDRFRPLPISIRRWCTLSACSMRSVRRGQSPTPSPP